jgi:hypothetical protein
MPVIMVMFGAWKPPGSEKIVRKGGKYTVSETLAASLVKINPDKYKVLNDGKSISSRKTKQGNVQRESGAVDLQRRGSDVDPDVGFSGADNHPGDDGK